MEMRENDKRTSVERRERKIRKKAHAFKLNLS